MESGYNRGRQEAKRCSTNSMKQYQFDESASMKILVPRFFALLIAMLIAPTLIAEQTPNIVVIFCDDMGYGDLNCFGNPAIATPRLDEMASEGQKWTQFYVAAPVCTPSRAALMTGRYPIRNGMTSSKRVVLFPDSGGGLPQDEVTIAEMLKPRGYATGCFGKWHLGHLPEFLPTSQGFDTYFGIPYSNDMDKVAGTPNYRKEAHADPHYFAKSEYFNVPLMRDEEIVEQPADQTTITRRYTTEAIKFIEQNKDQPFFVYLAHSMPHIPLFVSKDFRKKSRRGLFGDVIEEIDFNVGRLLDKIRELDLDEKTLVVFSSDNGPWLSFQTHGGSAGPLRAGKGTTFEGGMRVPTVFWWPGKVKPGVVTELGCTMDLMKTFASLAGGSVPEDRKLDSFDLSQTLLERGPSPRNGLFYWTRAELHAVRQGPWKLHVKFREPINYGRAQILKKPVLYHVEHDLSEQFDVADKHPEIVEQLLRVIQDHKGGVREVPDNLAIPANP